MVVVIPGREIERLSFPPRDKPFGFDPRSPIADSPRRSSTQFQILRHPFRFGAADTSRCWPLANIHLGRARLLSLLFMAC